MSVGKIVSVCSALFEQINNLLSFFSYSSKSFINRRTSSRNFNINRMCIGSSLRYNYCQFSGFSTAKINQKRNCYDATHIIT